MRIVSGLQWAVIGSIALLLNLLRAVPAFAQFSSGPNSGSNSSGGITNPLGDVTIISFIVSVIEFLLGLSAILAFAAIVYGGIRLVASFGSDQSVQTGKNVIKWAVIGIIVIMLSYTILSTVSQFLGVNP